jgi:hypothetical protein
VLAAQDARSFVAALAEVKKREKRKPILIDSTWNLLGKILSLPVWLRENYRCLAFFPWYWIVLCCLW